MVSMQRLTFSRTFENDELAEHAHIERHGFQVAVRILLTRVVVELPFGERRIRFPLCGMDRIGLGVDRFKDGTQFAAQPSIMI